MSTCCNMVNHGSRRDIIIHYYNMYLTCHGVSYQILMFYCIRQETHSIKNNSLSIVKGGEFGNLGALLLGGLHCRTFWQA
jgi:hypothetical protein